MGQVRARQGGRKKGLCGMGFLLGDVIPEGVEERENWNSLEDSSSVREKRGFIVGPG